MAVEDCIGIESTHSFQEPNTKETHPMKEYDPLQCSPSRMWKCVIERWQVMHVLGNIVFEE